MIILFESSEDYFTEFTYQWEILNSYANFQSSKITHYSCCLIWILHKGLYLYYPASYLHAED